ncbi:MAG: AAA-associated domain-containing protein, partial [Nitrososphaerota archaeon]
MSQDGPKCPLDVTPGMIAGLLDVVGLFKGRVDLAQLSKEIGMELGHLLRVLEAAEALGLVSVIDGDVQLTQSGLGFSRRLLTGKIKMLTEIVEKVEPFRSIIQY